MKEIKNILKIDKEIGEIFEIYSCYIIETKIIKDFPNTIKLLQNLDISINSIKQGILDSITSDNLFTLNILFRSQIEHFIKFHYLFFKFFESKNDFEAEKYKKVYFAKEEIEKLKAIEHSRKFLDDSYIEQTAEYLMKCNFLFNDFRSKKELEKQSKEYEYKNIINYIGKLAKEMKGEKIIFFSELIILYSELSSFIHGGLNSTQEMVKMKDEELRKYYYFNRCKLTCQMSITVKYYILYLICTHQKDKEKFDPFLKEVGKKLDGIAEL